MQLNNLEVSKAKFTGDFRVLESKDLDLLGFSKASLLSEASSLIPAEFNADKNIDILPVVFNVAVVNKFNANHDGIDSKGAAEILKQFIHKPINIEHIKPYIIGHIVNASFSDKQPDYEENDIAEFEGRNTPFYITLAGFIYRHVYPDLAEALILNSNPESEYYQMYSSSWEISFSDYKIATGSDLVSDCKIYSRDENPESFAKCVDKLKQNGGTGFSEEGQVSRLLGGKMFPLGCAFTENPAADVSGIYTLSSLLGDDEEDDDDNEMEEDDSKESTCNKNIQDEEKTSVTNNDEFNFMTDEQFKLFMEAIANSKGGESKASAEVAKQFEAVLIEHGTEWKSKAEKAEETLAALKEDSEKTAKELSEATEKLVALEADLKVKEAADRLNARINTISSAYELTEDEEKIVVDDVRAIGESDEDFNKYLAKAKVVFAHRDRVAIAAKSENKTEDKQEKTDELETEGESKASVTNNNGDQANEKSLIDQLRETGLELE